MNDSINQNPEQKARDQIDSMLLAAGWVVQPKNKVDLSAGLGIAVLARTSASGANQRD